MVSSGLLVLVCVIKPSSNCDITLQSCSHTNMVVYCDAPLVEDGCCQACAALGLVVPPVKRRVAAEQHALSLQMPVAVLNITPSRHVVNSCTVSFCQ